MAEPGFESVLVKVWAMTDPLPADAPVTPDETAVHENVTPEVLLLKVIPEVAPEQIDSEEGVACTSGIGFTVTKMLALAVVPHEGVPASVAKIRK